MSFPASVERAKTYLDAHLSRPSGFATPQSGPHEGPFVTISRESGTGGSSLARLLADHLNAANAAAPAPAWTVFDQNLVDEVLRAHDLSPQLSRFMPEDKVPAVESSVRELVGLHPNLWTLVQQTNTMIRALAKHGHAIIVGRGGNFATPSVQHGLHLRLVAPTGYRAELLARRLRISVAEAAAQNRQVDAARRDYVRAVFDVNVADPNAYDLVLNVARTPLPAIVEMLAPIIQRHTNAAEHVRAITTNRSARVATTA